MQREGELMEAVIEPSGRVYCPCPDYQVQKRKHPRHCEHTDKLRRERLLKLVATGGFYFVLPDIPISKDKCERVVLALEHLVRRVEAVPPLLRYQSGHELEMAMFRAESAVLVGGCGHMAERLMHIRRDIHQLREAE
jgi:hypothetical protein